MLEKLKEFFEYQDTDPQFEGKVINVTNQLPYNCIIQHETNHGGLIENLSKFKIGTLRSAVENHDLTPISGIERRRRSTIVALGQTNIWKLSARSGHSAMYAGLDSLKKDYQTLYIGGTGPITNGHKEQIEAESVSEEERQSLRDLLESKHDMAPVFVPENLSSGHYEGYSKQILWPLMHYLMWSDKIDEATHWKEYVAVNQMFADEAIKNYKKGDIIWVHDYHLMLVPQMIRITLPEAHIGLFLHTPFPSSEIFRCLPHRKEILEGILGANLVAFHTYNYARHFASTCTRILGYEYTVAGILSNGTLIQIGIYPIGIDVERTKHHYNSPGVDPKAKAIRERYMGKKIIVGRDKLDRAKGVLQKLESFETFLKNFPQWREKVVLIQVTSPGALNSTELENKAAEIVARINSTYGSLGFTPVNLFNHHIDRDEYYALLKVADICLVTPILYGINTASLEYVVAQEERHSPLILSEFSGTANSMSSAVIVNPWDFSEVARAIDECLSMSEDEKLIKYQQLQRFVTSHTAGYWARSLVKNLLNLPKDISGTTTRLDVSRVMLEYTNRKKRAFFFDYDATLVPVYAKSKDTEPPQKSIDVIRNLTSDCNNIVWIVSSRTKDYLEKWLGSISNLGLASEHGCFIRDPNSTKWTSLMKDMDMSWMDDVKEIFEYYTERTPGSFIEEKENSLTWHYGKADPKFGAFQAMECQNHLEQNVVGKLPIESFPGKMCMEVRPTLANKSVVVNRVLTQNSDVDFVLCAGDDRVDEDMFRILERLEISSVEAVLFTVIISKFDKKTIASWKLDSIQEFIDLLKCLADQE